jgi:hypothetical protein
MAGRDEVSRSGFRVTPQNGQDSTVRGTNGEPALLTLHPDRGVSAMRVHRGRKRIDGCRCAHDTSGISSGRSMKAATTAAAHGLNARTL